MKSWWDGIADFISRLGTFRRRIFSYFTTAQENMLTVVIISGGYGIDMIVQPMRYSRTPSYANLLKVMPAPYWGAAYLLIAILGLVAVIWKKEVKKVSTVVFPLAAMLFLWWWVAFVVRWATDSSTTIVNLGSWSMLLILLGRAIPIVDGDDPDERDR